MPIDEEANRTRTPGNRERGGHWIPILHEFPMGVGGGGGGGF